MPTYVFKCKGCGGHKPFLIHEGEKAGPESNNPIERHCPTCRTMTTWVFAFPAFWSQP